MVGFHVPKGLLEVFAKTEIATADLRVEEWGKHERTIYSSDSETDPRFVHPITRLLPHKSLLIQPMRWKGATIGGFAGAWVKEQDRVTTDAWRGGGGIGAPGGPASRDSRVCERGRRQVA